MWVLQCHKSPKKKTSEILLLRKVALDGLLFGIGGFLCHLFIDRADPDKVQTGIRVQLLLCTYLGGLKDHSLGQQ